MCIRVPVTSSNRSRICSRSRKQYQNIEIAPSSRPDVPSHTRCEWIRFSSASSMRIHVALRGTSMSEQLLDREHEDELVVLERDVVDPRRVRDRLPPRLLLHVLLEAGVEVADHRAAGRRPSRRARSMTSRSTPCVDGWFGPKLTSRTSPDARRSSVTCRIVGIGRRDPRALVDAAGAAARRHVTRRPRSAPARRRSDSPCAADAPPSRRP